MHRLFIIAPHFPPSALPPSQRVRLMVKHTQDLGFETTIFTTFNKYREEDEDAWMVTLAGNNFKKITTRSLHQKYSRKVGFGDLGLRFIPFLFFRLLSECRKNRPHFIIYPVPPWYLLIIAPLLKRITGVPYAIDFIDPWVRSGIKKEANLKKKVSQWIALRLEGWVTKHAAYIYAVSERINEDLVARHPDLRDKPFRAIPYGVEVSDFKGMPKGNAEDYLLVRYIGAVWPASYSVIYEVLEMFKALKSKYDLRVEFVGTSYAGKELAKPVLDKFTEQLKIGDFVLENPNRVTYKQAVKLTNGADILFLFGDTGTQYAASKLMGLIASQRPLFAFLHRGSFPYKFLHSMNYKYLVGYSSEQGDLPEDNRERLVEAVDDLVSNLRDYQPISVEDELFIKHTSYGMTEEMVKPIKEIITKN